MLTLLFELRGGGGDWERFSRYADSMLEEREFFIRKASAWILPEVSRSRPERTHRFVRERIDRISGLTLREAIRHLEPKTTPRAGRSPCRRRDLPQPGNLVEAGA